MTIMNCRQATKIMGSSARITEAAPVSEARQHLAACASCRRHYSLERMAVILIREHAAPPAREALFPSPYFFTRLRARIKTEQAEPGTAFWEAAVTTARSWLLAFGSVTAILLAASMLTWQARTNTPEFSNEALALPTSNENMVIANREPLSRDAVLELFGIEDYDHARK